MFKPQGDVEIFTNLDMDSYAATLVAAKAGRVF